MFANFITAPTRPNKVSDIKNLDYHVKMARYCIGAINKAKYQVYINKMMRNWAFYKGVQWILDEDLDTFLMDESGEVRNRIRLVENIVRPLVKMLKNNAIRVDYTYKAAAINPQAIQRREKELTRMLNLQTIAQNLPPEQGEMIKANFHVGESDGETEDLFDKNYSDALTKGINYLINFISQQNEVDDIKVRQAEFLAVGGICISQEFELSGSQAWDVLLPATFFWDMNAVRPNLSDGEFMGHMSMEMPVSIYEQNEDMPERHKETIENYVKQRKFDDWSYLNKIAGITETEGRVPRIRVEWRDNERQEWGWISEYGVETFLRVNYKGGKYATKDLIFPSDVDKRKKLNGNKLMVRYPTVTRFAEFIPKEMVGSGTKDDIVLKWGVIPYSEQSYMSLYSNPFSYKPSTFEYYDGEIAAPIDDVIDPQRLVNRINSMAESTINNSRGANSIFDRSMISEDGEEEILRSMNLGKPIFLENTGGLIQNAVGKYDATLVPTANIMFQIKDAVVNTARNNIGINEAMTGTQGGKRELVGVNNAMIERGSLMQEGFYYSLDRLLLQMAQSMATRGKCIFVENNSLIYYAVGERYTKALQLSREYLNEYFRVFVTRTTPETDQKMVANAFALQMLNLGLLDKVRFAAVFNSGTIEDVTRMVQDAIAEQDYIEKQQAPMQLQQAQQQDNMNQQMAQQKMQVPLEKERIAQVGNIGKELIKQQNTEVQPQI
jgi:hypothetical protein